ncbi:hypothetical protein AAC387_Pa12g0840 [Persea americana]
MPHLGIQPTCTTGQRPTPSPARPPIFSSWNLLPTAIAAIPALFQGGQLPLTHQPPSSRFLMRTPASSQHLGGCQQALSPSLNCCLLPQPATCPTFSCSGSLI